jgi:FkbM family methyltransferase
MSRTVSPTGRHYVTYDPEQVHEQLWSRFSGASGWDVGANTGQSVARMVGQFGHVTAFEPCWQSFAELAEDWDANPRVTLVQSAVGDAIGKLELSVRPAAIAGGQLVAADMPVTAQGWWAGETGRVTVPCTTLDAEAAVRGKPDFIKVDTEGGERRVLAGARGVIAAGCSWLIEFHSPRLRAACLKALGRCYVWEQVRHPEAKGDPARDDNGWLLAWPA